MASVTTRTNTTAAVVGCARTATSPAGA
jgi:hypothetical protein